jgi:hypothetical protein
MNVTISRPEAVRFLARHEFGKDPARRLYSWLACLDICETPASLLAPREDIPQDNQPTAEDDGGIVQCDLNRSVIWFNGLAKEAALPDDRLKDAHQAAEHILTRLSARGSPYFQGFDRFVWISYIVSLQFADAQNQPNSTAEALAFHLSRRLIEYSDITRYARCDESVQDEFRELDQYVERNFSEIHKQLSHFGHRSIFYALRWKLLWFCDEHSLPSILLLWDSIIAHLGELRGHLFDLSVAHLAQIPVHGDDQKLILEKIQQHREWDIEKIFTDAQNVAQNRIATTQKGPRPKEEAAKRPPHGSRRPVQWALGLAFMIALFLCFKAMKG